MTTFLGWIHGTLGLDLPASQLTFVEIALRAAVVFVAALAAVRMADRRRVRSIDEHGARACGHRRGHSVLPASLPGAVVASESRTSLARMLLLKPA